MALTKTMPDWLERTDLCEARVKLGGKDDHAVILALTPDVVIGRINELRDAALAMLPEATDLDVSDPQGLLDVARDVLQSALTPHAAGKLIKLVSDLIRCHVSSWQITGMDFNTKPGDINPKALDAIVRKLPIPIIGRIVQGLVLLSGNW